MEEESGRGMEGRGLSERACRMLAGADVGVAGGALVLFWLTFAARMQGEYWWSKWNVAGAVFYGERVYGMGWGRASLAGAAILLLVYAVLGVLFSFLARPRGLVFNAMAGLTVALLWHQAGVWLFWPKWGPGVAFYLHPVVMLPANVVFGLALVRFGPRYRSVALTLGAAEWAGAFRPAAPVEPRVQEGPVPEPPPLPAAIWDEPAGGEAEPGPEKVPGTGPETVPGTGPGTGMGADGEGSPEMDEKRPDENNPGAERTRDC
jgi:hypothetical protein